MSSLTEVSPTLRRDWRLLEAAVFLFAFGFATYSVVFLNYITERLGVTPWRMGCLESSREIPGLLAVGIAAAVASFPEARIGAVCLMFSALGVAATGFVRDFPELVVVTVFWSVFMHQWFTSSSAIPLALAAGQEGGRHLGRMGAIGAGATITAYGLARLLTGHFSYPMFFVLAAAFIFAGGLCLLPMSPHSATLNRKRLLWRREYRLYYGLTFLEGCRRQIFSTFAIFALVNQYKTPLAQIAVLMLVNAVATFLVASPAGRLIDRIGERRAMTIYYFVIALAFLGYAVTTSVRPLMVLYVVDNILFSLGVSITTYLNRIVRPGELMPSLSMGQTMNHVAAVAIPISGGLLWTRFGYHAPFWAGVIAALVSLALTQRVGHARTIPAAQVAEA
ncbi:MAG: MFS transporter [Armatimonadetes bacterium]|nr:MFS transporter [Armatimonadota bacterium]